MVNPSRAAAGRNQATAHDPGPPPGASLASAANSGRPASEDSPSPRPSARVMTSGKTRTPPVTAMARVSPSPRSLRPPTTGKTRNATARSAKDSAAPGENATPTARIIPVSTTRRVTRAGRAGPKPARTRAESGGTTAISTSVPILPCENAHISTEERP